MKTYEMLEPGRHREGGKVYRMGDVVTSHRPLDELHPGRFREILAAAPVAHEPEEAPVKKSGRTKPPANPQPEEPVDPEDLFIIVHLGQRRYDVTDAEGSPLNKEPLTIHKAKALRGDLIRQWTEDQLDA